jgi:hypothetical protein
VRLVFAADRLARTASVVTTLFPALGTDVSALKLSLRHLSMLCLESASASLRLSQDGSLPAEFESGKTIPNRPFTKAIAAVACHHVVRAQRLRGSLVPNRRSLLGRARSQYRSAETGRMAASIRNSESHDSKRIPSCP